MFPEARVWREGMRVMVAFGFEQYGFLPENIVQEADDGRVRDMVLARFLPVPDHDAAAKDERFDNLRLRHTDEDFGIDDLYDARRDGHR